MPAASQPARTSVVQWTPRKTREPLIARTVSAAVVQAVVRPARRARGQSRPTSTAQVIAEAIACPEGKAGPSACATGSEKAGRWRPKESFSTHWPPQPIKVWAATQPARVRAPISQSQSATMPRTLRMVIVPPMSENICTEAVHTV